MRHHSLVLACLIVPLCSAQGVAAEPPSTADIASRVLLGYRLPIASASYLSDNGPGKDSDVRNLNVSLAGANMNFSSAGGVIGFALTDAALFDLRFDYARYKGGTDYENKTLSLSPGFTYVLASGQTVRPFVGGRIGLSRTTWPFQDTWEAGAGASAGVQLHIAEHLSLDPFVEAMYWHGVAKDMSGYSNGLGALAGDSSLDVDAQEDPKRSQNRLSLVGGVSVSVWL